MTPFQVLLADAQGKRDVATALGKKACDALAACNIEGAMAATLAAAPATMDATVAFTKAAGAARYEPPETRARVAEATAAMADACRVMGGSIGAAGARRDAARAGELADLALRAAIRLDKGGAQKAAATCEALFAHVKASTQDGRRWPPPAVDGIGGPGA